MWTILFSISSECLFSANPVPKTFSKDWQDATANKIKEKKMNPISHPENA
jgi:hypothetical protein